MKTERLREIQIDQRDRRRNSSPFVWILFAVALPTVAAAFLALTRSREQRTIGEVNPAAAAAAATASPTVSPPPAPSRDVANAPATPDTPPSDVTEATGAVLTVSGYIINRERIELGPRELGKVKWLGVKKGDRVKKDDVLVLLENDLEEAQLRQAQAQLQAAEAALGQAQTRFDRTTRLRASRVSSEEEVENLQWDLQLQKARVAEAKAAVATAQTRLEWTIIRAPIDGVVLEKLVDANELVSPQSFGGDRSPSTALVALADPADLQVEIELNERDVAKVSLGMRCRVSPEAYPDRNYGGYVAEMAPEASRQKGTLQVKVQIENPDQFLTPNLNAKVDFLTDAPGSQPRAISGTAPHPPGM